MPQIVKFLKELDPLTCKAAEVRHVINERYGKQITYSQVAYELSKLKRKLLSESKTPSQVEEIKKQSYVLNRNETPSSSTTIRRTNTTNQGTYRSDSKVKSEPKSTVIVRSPQKCSSTGSKPNSK